MSFALIPIRFRPGAAGSGRGRSVVELSIAELNAERPEFFSRVGGKRSPGVGNGNGLEVGAPVPNPQAALAR